MRRSRPTFSPMTAASFVPVPDDEDVADDDQQARERQALSRSLRQRIGEIEARHLELTERKRCDSD